MKNLLIYVNPEGFDSESEELTKIQIDNSLDLGWKKEDLFLVTNFSFEHNGISSIVIDKGFCEYQKEASKVTVLAHLFETGFIQRTALYWIHDLDAYQLETITEDELDLDKNDCGFCDYTRITRIQMGTFFFKKTSADIFQTIIKKMTPKNAKGAVVNDEDAINEMVTTNENNITNRIKMLDGRYDFGLRRIDYCYERVTKPLKILHFHPHHPRIEGLDTLGKAMYGRNSIKRPLMNERSIKIFNKYGYS